MHLQVSTSGEAVGGSRYRTLGRLGSGGMAEVDLALQTGVAGSSRLCVLKRVRHDLAARQEFVSMFFEEARISASLNHPNIVQIYEVGGDEQDCFLALEFLRGRSYAHVQRMVAGDRLDYRVDLEVMCATLAGLEHAHQRKDLSGEPMRLVHRDISPPNVFVTYDGEIKLLDFGVAKSKDSLVKTEAGILKGKVAFMAPEMVAGDPFDARADLYAVGVMLWEATAGRDRWPNMNDVAILAQLARGGRVEPPDAAARGLPVLADAICVRALAEDPFERYQTAAEFRQDVERLCEALGGRLSQAELREYMQRRFAADREREERDIESALRQERITPGGGPLADGEVSGFTKRVRRISDGPPQTPSGALANEPSPQKPARGRVWLVVAAAVIVIALLLKLTAFERPSAVPGATAPTNEGAKLLASAPPLGAAPSAVVASEAPSAASTAIKPGKVAKSAQKSARPSPVPASSKALQLDRRDPWQE